MVELHLGAPAAVSSISVLMLGADWLLTGALQKMVLVVTSVATKEVLERWTFDIQTDREVLDGG